MTMSFKEVISSRTIWTAVIGLALAIWQAVAPFIDSQLFAVVEAIILAVAGFFRINASQGIYVDKRVEDIPMNKE